jgi:hypothetical protein
VSLRTAVAIALAALSAPAAATDVFPGRGGESGLLDVPTADAVAPGSGMLTSELNLSHVRGTRGMALSPFPLSVVTGVARGLEAGAALRQWGRPGDPAPTPTLFAAALKLHLADADALLPALAVDAYVDRANENRTGGARAIATTPQLGRARLSAFVGAEALSVGRGIGATAGVGASIELTPRLDVACDGLFTRDGALAGAALRWQLTHSVGVTLGGDWVPREGGLRVGIGFAVAARPARRQAAPTPPRPAPVVEVAPKPAPAARAFLDDRPRFRMRLDLAGEQPQRAHLVASAAPGAASRASARPSAEEVGQRERQAAADHLEALARRLRTAEGALAAREERLAASRERLAARERETAARGAALDARELALGTPGMATHRELKLAEAEDQARAAERDLSRQERDSQGAIDAAAARERAAREREAAASDAAERDAAGRAEWLKRGEERIAAARDRLEATEVAQSITSSRVDAAERLLSLRVDRLALLERRAPAGAGPAAAPGEAPRDAREALLAHRRDVERCVEAELARLRIVRADGVLRVRVAATGRVAAATYEPDLGAPLGDECLAEAARAWTLPAAPAPYSVDVPITVVATGGAR